MKFEIKYLEKYTLLSVIVCILIISTGYSFAYFASEMKVENVKDSGIKVETAKFLQVTYDAGNNKIDVPNAYPGMANIVKNFSVTVNPSKDQTTALYDILFNITENTFEVCSDSNKNDKNNCTIGAQELTYSLSGVDSAGKSILSQSGNLTNGVKTIAPIRIKHETNGKAETYNYTLTISFLNTNADQNHNVGKTLKGSIDVQLASN